MKITQKILEVMKQISSEAELGKLNEVLIAQVLISKSEYEIVHQSERVDSVGIVWQIVTVSCELTIVDTESDEIMVNVALGQGIDPGGMAVTKAQDMAREMAWKSALNLPSVVVQDITGGPDIVVETPEDKLKAQIVALWKWDVSMFPGYIAKRFAGRFIEDLNVTELTVIADELRNYKG